MATKKKTAIKKKPSAKKKASAKKSSAKEARAKSATRLSAKKSSAKGPATDAPQLFRVNIEVSNIDEAVTFYSSLLGVVGHKSPGSRAFFPAGAASLMVVDVSSVHAPHPAAKALYFTVRDLDAAFARASALGCLSQEDVHDKPGGGIVVRPWGERSFYVVDPWQNPLCFVEAGTVYGG